MLYKDGELTSNYTYRFVTGIENEDGTDGALAYNHTVFYKDKGVIEFVPSGAYTLKAGESVTLPVKWTTTSMTDGTYNDQLHLVSNDPLQQQVAIPLTLQVIGTTKLTQTDTVAFKNVIAFYDTTAALWQTFRQPVYIKNEDTKIITINSLNFSSPAYLSLQDSFNIVYPVILYPGEELTYNIKFTPDSTVSVLNEKLIINTDDGQVASVAVVGTVAMPPAITIDSTTINITMQQKDTAVRTVQIGNIMAKEAWHIIQH